MSTVAFSDASHQPHGSEVLQHHPHTPALLQSGRYPFPCRPQSSITSAVVYEPDIESPSLDGQSCRTSSDTPTFESGFRTAPAFSVSGLIHPLSAHHNHPPDAKSRQPQIHIDQVAPFWERYNKAADFEDKEFVKTLGANLDTLLIFAGLFSAVNTAFIVESLKTVQEDQASITNDLLRSVLLVSQNVTPPELKPFEPTSQGVWCTAMFFASLSCSLVAAFGAVLGKQWLNHYEREGVLKPPPGRGRERQKKFDGRAEWHMEAVIESLPNVLQISLFLFLIALIIFLWSINKHVRYVVVAFSTLPVLFYAVTTTIAAIYPLSPFQTPASISIRSLFDMIQESALPIHGISARLKSPLVSLKQDLSDRLQAILRTLQPYMKPLKGIWEPLLRVLRDVNSSRPKWHTRNPEKYSEGVWNLRCLEFYLRRASTPEDLNQALMAMSVLPRDLKIDRRDSTIPLLGETLLKFVIKPNLVSESQDYTTNLETYHFQLLLNALHILYTSWKDLDHPSALASQYFTTYRSLIRVNLWRLFAQDPRNVESVSLIADIMEFTGIHNDDDCSIANQTLLWQCIQLPMHNTAEYLPYITLIAYQPICRHLENFVRGEHGGRVAEGLYAAMWRDDKPDLNHARATLRAKVLPDLFSGDDSTKRFCKYFSKCCEKYLVDKDSQRKETWVPAVAAGPSYLRAIYQLVHRDLINVLSPKQVGKLARLLRKMFGPHDSSGVEPAISRLAFVSLWWQCKLAAGVTDRPPFPFMTRDSVAGFVYGFRVVGEVEEGHLDAHPSRVAAGLRHTVQYLEEASARRLLRQDMASILEEFQYAAAKHLGVDLDDYRELSMRISALDLI